MKRKYFQNRELDFMIAFLITTVFFTNFHSKCTLKLVIFFLDTRVFPNKGEISNRLILVTKNEKNTQQIIIDFITYGENIIAYISPTVKAL